MSKHPSQMSEKSHNPEFQDINIDLDADNSEVI